MKENLKPLGVYYYSGEVRTPLASQIKDAIKAKLATQAGRLRETVTTFYTANSKNINTGLALGLLGIGAYKLASSYYGDRVPNAIYQGIDIIPTDANFRLSPNIPVPGDQPNTIDRGDIYTIDGTQINATNVFKVQNPKLVAGEDPFNPQGNAMWVEFNVGLDHGLKTVKGYVCTDVVETSEQGTYLSIISRDGKKIITQNPNTNQTITFKGSQIGKITQQK